MAENIKINNDIEVIRSIRIELYPTEEQKLKISKYINATRFIYNQTINFEEELYEKYKKGESDISFIGNSRKDELKILNYIKLKNNWISEIPQHMSRRAIKRATNGYKRFFKKIARKPKYHPKQHSTRSFDARSDHFYIDIDKVKLEGFGFDTISCHPTNFNKNDRFYGITVSIDAVNRYWLTANYIKEKDMLILPRSKKALGIDLGCRSDNSNTIVCSDGTRYCQPNTSRLEFRLKRYQRKCQKDYDRRKHIAEVMNVQLDDLPKSNRERKRELKRNKVYKKIHNIKNTFYHQASADIVKKDIDCIVMETIEVERIKNDNKFINLSRVSFYDIRKKIEYKAEQKQKGFILADPTFPSSQICSVCGFKKKISNVKYFRCPNCGAIIDRDDNASINLERLAYII